MFSSTWLKVFDIDFDLFYNNRDSTQKIPPSDSLRSISVVKLLRVKIRFDNMKWAFFNLHSQWNICPEIRLNYKILPCYNHYCHYISKNLQSPRVIKEMIIYTQKNTSFYGNVRQIGFYFYYPSSKVHFPPLVYEI